MRLNDKKKAILDLLVENFGAVFTRKQALALIKSNGGTIADVRFIFNNKAFRAGRGQYDVSSLISVDTPAETSEAPVEGASVGNTSVVGQPTVTA